MIGRFRDLFPQRSSGVDHEQTSVSSIKKTTLRSQGGKNVESPQVSIHFQESPSTPDTDVLSHEGDLSLPEVHIEENIAFYDDSLLTQEEPINDVVITSKSFNSELETNIVDAPFASLLKPKVRSSLGDADIDEDTTSMSTSELMLTIDSPPDDEKTGMREHGISNKHDSLRIMRERQAQLLKEIETAIKIYNQQERLLAATASNHMEHAAQHLESRNKFGAAMSMRRTKRVQQDQFQLQQTVEFLKQQKSELQLLDIREHDVFSSQSSFEDLQEQVDQVFAQVSWKLVVAKSMAAKTKP